MSRIMVFWSDRNIKMPRNVVFRMSRESKIPRNSQITKKSAKLKLREDFNLQRFFTLK